MQISLDLLVKAGVNPVNGAKYLAALNEQLPWYDINTPLRIAHFLAQVLHESALMKATSENLNYSDKALLQVFGKYFTEAEALQFARRQEAIANRVYADRMGNGPESSGDGYRYRGRGLIQLTGRENYERFAKWLKVPGVVDNPDLVATKYPVHSAVYYWDSRKLNAMADRDDVRGITYRINGGFSGLEDRRELLAKLKRGLRIE